MSKIANAGPANFSVHAAVSAGLLSHNALVMSVNGKALAVPATLSALISTGVVNPSLPASALGVSQFGGD